MIDWSDKFWCRVHPEALSGCWLWHGAVDSDGYGRMNVRHKHVGAHRVAYERSAGAIPAGLMVRHTCDVPACVNPDHLVLGTHVENMADMSARGRSLRGARNPKSKLTRETAAAVLERYAAGETTRSIARSMGVSQATVSHIICGRRWPDISRPTRDDFPETAEQPSLFAREAAE